MSVYDQLQEKFNNGNVTTDGLPSSDPGVIGSPVQGPSLSSYTDASGVTYPNTGGPPAGGMPSPPAGGTGGAGAGIPGQGFDEEYWKKMLTGGVGGGGAPLGGGGNVFGAGPGANADLEAILMQQGLPALDAQTLSAFVAAREAQMQQAQGQFTVGRDALMEDMFGRNMQRSTVAGEAGGRMLEGQARTLAGIEAQDAMARLGQQNVMADRLQRGAATAGDIRGKYRSAQASENAAASSANATRAIASAQIQAADIASRSRMSIAMAELDLKRELGLGALDIQGDQLDFSYWAKEGDWASGIAMIKESEPTWWESLLGFTGAVLPEKTVEGWLS